MNATASTVHRETSSNSEFRKILHPKKRAFLAAFSRCGSLSLAAKRAKVDRRSHYNWLKSDPAYREAFYQATVEAGDALEDRLMEPAFGGNVTAGIFLLKGLRPEKYREQRIIELNFQDWDGDLSKLSDESARRLLAQIEAMIAAEEAKSATLPAPGATVIDATLEQPVTSQPRSYLVDSKR